MTECLTIPFGFSKNMALGFTPGSSANPSTEVELTLSCRNLRNMDYLSKSDPMMVVSMYNVLTKQWKQIGRTEMILNNLNPDFATKILVEYTFETQQMLKFDVYDIDTNNLNKLEEHDFLGTAQASLGEVASSGKLTLDLSGPKEGATYGQIIIVAEEVGTNQNEVSFSISAKNLRRSFWGWLTESQAYLEFHKTDEQGSFSLVFRSEPTNWSSPTRWKPITLKIRSLCGGDMDCSIRIRVKAMRSLGEPRLIGETSVTLRQLSESPTGTEIPITHVRTGQIVGSLSISNFKIVEVFSFLEYIMGGLEMNCTVAIDFTASNGDPRHPESLHYINPMLPNQYEQALLAVVEILKDYDTDKQFPVLGFGAKIPPHGAVSHCFYVNMNPHSPFCDGVEGVMEAYRNCIEQVQLYGPTNFTPVIQHVTNYARAYQDGTQYFILLIVTDGVITDMLQTKQAIINASTLPLSIIIVGVGPADFDAMNELDSDDSPLSVHGHAAARDIVQFVPFREFQGHRDPAAARLHLAKEVLAEVPAQVVGFMKSKGYKPGTNTPGPSSAPPPYEP